MIFSLLLSFAAAAAETPATTQVDLIQQAQSELSRPLTPASSKKNAVPVTTISAKQTELILKLEDDYQDPKVREFLWSFGVFLQEHRPEGTRSLATGDENIGDSGSTFLPTVAMGALYNLSNGREDSVGGAWQVGLEGEAGFTSQKIAIQTAGQSFDARLNTMLTELRVLARWGLTLKSKFHARLGAGQGRLNYTQSSDNSLMRWSENGQYHSFLLGLDYGLTRRWTALVQAKTISAQSSWPTSIDAPSTQLEIGAQILW